MSAPNNAQSDWKPVMKYRQDKDRHFGSTTTLLEDYADTSIVPCWRQYKHHQNPNHRWDQEVDVAVKVSNSVDFIDNNVDAIHHIVWGMTHPNDCHPGVKSIVENEALVDLLLIRHFKAHGGLVLPPLRAARDLQAAHEMVARDEVAHGLTWDGGRTIMKYPNWRDTRNTAPPPGFAPAAAGRGNALIRGGRGGGFAGRGRGRGGLVGLGDGF